MEKTSPSLVGERVNDDDDDVSGDTDLQEDNEFNHSHSKPYQVGKIWTFFSTKSCQTPSDNLLIPLELLFIWLLAEGAKLSRSLTQMIGLTRVLLKTN